MRGLGRKRYWLTIEGLVTGSPQKLPSGAPNQAWGTLAQVWGSIDHLSGRELFSAQAINPEARSKIGIWYRADVTPAVRITYENRIYNVLDVDDPEMKHWELVLLVSEGLNRG